MDGLLQRIEKFRIDEPGTLLTFERRLARETGWDAGYASRVVREYKRFLFLAATEPKGATPSNDVDEAWHLHLTYTRSYWDYLCRDVLGKPLHHNPTQGAANEDAKYLALYEATLVAYERCFGELPPTDIWPRSQVRFARQSRRVVDATKNWVIAKPRLALFAIMPIAAAAIVGPAILFGVAAVLLIGYFAFANSRKHKQHDSQGGSGVSCGASSGCSASVDSGCSSGGCSSGGCGGGCSS